MSTSLIAVDAHLAKAAELMDASDDYRVQAGREGIAARELCKDLQQFKAACRRNGVEYKTLQNNITLARKTPDEVADFRAAEVVRVTASQKKSRNYGTNVSAENKDLAPAASKGELHEATRGFVAMIKKAKKAGDEDDWRTSRERRTVAFAHFKLLLTQSNLPSLMSMSADEIIELIRMI